MSEQTETPVLENEETFNPKVVNHLVDTTEASDSIDGDVFGNDPSEEDSVKASEEIKQRRAKKPYQIAVARPKSKMEMALGDTDDIFGGLFEDEVEVSFPSLASIQVTQEEIRSKLKGSNGLTMVSTFTGCGGSDTGFAWSGWEPLMAVEFVDSARETLNANYDSYIISPESLVGKAKEIAADMGVELKFERQRRVKGKIIPPSIDWGKTLAGLENAQQDELRYRVTREGLKAGRNEGTPIFGDDIRGLSPQAFMDHFNLEVGKLDCLEGSPPCKSFSTAGLREKGWGQILHYSDERHQRTDDLFLEFLRLLEGFRPRSFVAENVAGIGMGTAETEVLVPLMDAFRELGYHCEAKVLNSKNYGVPQSRPRMFFIGIRKDQILDNGRYALPVFPEQHDVFYTVQDALDFASPSNTEENLKHVSLENYETGKIWKILEQGSSPQNKAYQLIRCHPNAPAPTITATSAGNQPGAGPTHPHECRKFTIPEYKALFSFPQDYVFTGNLDQQGERMGRSVPPYLMKQIADTLAEVLKRSKSVEE